MKAGKIPNPNTIHPIVGYNKEIYVKPTIKNTIVGDFVKRCTILDGPFNKEFLLTDMYAREHFVFQKSLKNSNF